MDFHTRTIRCLVAVADAHSFSDAARHLGLSQPTLSLRIQALEKQIGFPVFERGGRTIEPTSEGQEVIKMFRDLLESIDQAGCAVEKLRTGESHVIFLGISAYSGAAERTRLLADFAEQFPSDVIKLETAYHTTLLDRLADGKLDLVVATAPPDDERFEFQVLRWFQPELIVPASSPLARKDVLEPRDVLLCPLVAFLRDVDPRLYDATIKPFIDLGGDIVIPPDHSSPGILAYAAAKGCSTIVSFPRYSSAEINGAGMVARPIAMSPLTALMVLRKKDAPGTPPAERFWNYSHSKFNDSVSTH